MCLNAGMIIREELPVAKLVDGWSVRGSDYKNWALLFAGIARKKPTKLAGPE